MKIINNDKDITKEGVEGLKGIRNADLYSGNSEPSSEHINTEEEDEEIKKLHEAFRSIDNAKYEIDSNSIGNDILFDPATYEIRPSDIEYSSMFDPEGLLVNPTQETVNDIRAENQPWYAKVAAGMAKSSITAVTTFASGTAGLANGLLQGVANSFNKDENVGFLDGLWNNDSERAFQTINEESEKLFPNYYSQKEKEGSLGDRIFNANFIGDGLIKNVGFAVGAYYSGGVGTAAFKATKIPKLIGFFEKVTNTSKAISAIRRTTGMSSISSAIVGSTTAALNEARIEAINNSKDWYEEQISMLELDKNERIAAIPYQEGTVEYNKELYKINKAFAEACNQAAIDRAKMGNADMLTNLPILLASNMFEFGRLYANGYKPARKLNNVIFRDGKYTTKGTIKKSIAKGIGNAVSEGVEEVAQSVAASAASNYYSTDVMNFYKNKMDPHAEQETLSWINAFSTGLKQTLQEKSTIDEFISGALIGFLGIPAFRNYKSKSGEIQSPVVIRGGIFGEIQDSLKKRKLGEKYAQYLNNRVGSDKFIKYYQSLVRHTAFQTDMNDAVKKGDIFDFKNAEQAQLISDIIAFDNAGRLDDLVKSIEAVLEPGQSSTVIEDLKAITESTKDPETGLGPFTDDNGNDLYKTEEGREKMLSYMHETYNNIKTAIKEYQKTKDDLDVAYGEQFTDEQLQELTWMHSQIKNWNKRSEQIAEEIKPVFNTIISNMLEMLEETHNIKIEEGENNIDRTEIYDILESNERELESRKKLLKELASLNAHKLSILLAKKEDIKDAVKKIVSFEESGLTEDEANSIVTKIDDMAKMANARQVYESKLKEYLTNPHKLDEDEQETKEKTAKEAIETDNKKVAESIQKAKTVEELNNVINNSDNPENSRKIAKDLANSGNDAVKELLDMDGYNKRVQNKLSTLTTNDPRTREDALALWNAQFKNSQNLLSLANPNSIYTQDEGIFNDSSNSIEESRERFYNAQYFLSKAISEINNEDDFKDRFSEEYKKPIESSKNIPVNKSVPENSTTGNSDTPKIPVEKNPSPKSTKEIDTNSVGDYSSSNVSKENSKLFDKETNREDPNSKEFKGGHKYYMPIIAKFHIEGMKQDPPIFVKLNDVEGVRELERQKRILNGEKNPDVSNISFAEIYNKLEESGAFDYIDEGKLKEGDEIGFMIDEEWNKSQENNPYYKPEEPTIFIISMKDNQIIGSLPGAYKAKSFEGLNDLRNAIYEEYKKAKQAQINNSQNQSKESSLEQLRKKEQEKSKKLAENNKKGKEILKNKIRESMSKAVENDPEYAKKVVDKKYMPIIKDKTAEPKDRIAAIGALEAEVEKGLPISEENKNEIEEAKKELKEKGYSWDNLIFTEYNNGIMIGYVELIPDDSLPTGTRIITTVNSPSIFLNGELVTGANLIVTQAPFSTEEEELQYIEYEKYQEEIDNKFYTETDYNFDSAISGIEEQISLIIQEKNGNLDFKEKKLIAEGKGAIRALKEWKVRKEIWEKESELFKNSDKLFDYSENGIKRMLSQISALTSTVEEKTRAAFILNSIGINSDKIKNAIIDPKESEEKNNKLLENYNKKLSDILNSKEYKDRYEISPDLENLITENVNNQIKQTPDLKSENFVSSKTSKVTQIMNGRVPIDNNNRNLSEVVDSNKRKLTTIAVVKNGKLIINNKDIKEEDVTNLKDVSGKEGRMYLVLPNAKGKYSIVSVRARHFNKNEYNLLEDAQLKESSIGKGIINALTELASNPTDEVRKEAIAQLRNFLYLGDTTIQFMKASENKEVSGALPFENTKLIFSRPKKDENGNPIIKDGKPEEITAEVNLFSNIIIDDWINATSNPSAIIGALEPPISNHTFNFVKKPNEEIVKEIISALQKMNVPFQVDINKLNSNINMEDKPSLFTKNNEGKQIVDYDNYNDYIISENIITSNITEAAVLGGWFTFQYYDDGEFKDGERLEYPSDRKPSGNPTNNSGTDVNSVVNNSGVPIDNSENPTTVNLSTGKITEGNQKSKEATQLEKDIAAAQQAYGNARDGINLIDNKFIIKTSDGYRILDRDTNTYITGEEMNKYLPSDAFNQNLTEDSNKELENNVSDTVNTGTDNKRRRRPKLREKTSSIYKVFNKEKEKAWLDKVLPQLSAEGRIKFKKGLLRVAGTSSYAWGQFDGSIMTLSDLAAEGTIYHEAFHVVFNLLLDNIERENIFNEARSKYGNLSDLDLEEHLAEDFREFVAIRENDSKTLTGRIKNFFRDLKVKVLNWFRFRPSMNSYFLMINEGKYADKKINFSNDINTRNSKVEYTPEEQEIINKAKANGTFMKAPNGNPTNLKERQWVQVRTKAFKDWFGDWEKVNNFNLNNIDLSKVDYIIYDREKTLGYKSKAIKIFIKNKPELGYFELVKDKEFGNFSVHFKTGNADTKELFGSTKEQRAILYEQIRNIIPDGATVSTWGRISDGGKIALDKIGKNYTKIGEREIKDRNNNPTLIPIYQKGNGVSKVVDENGEPKVMYHGTYDDITIFNLNYFASNKEFSPGDRGKGFYFSSEEIANNYGPIVIPVFLNIRNPYNGNMEKYLNFGSTAQEVSEKLEELDKENLDKTVNRVLDQIKKNSKSAIFDYAYILKTDSKEEIKNKIREYYKQRNNRNFGNFDTTDGYISSYETVVYSSNQIKSAIDNIGTFDSNNDDIRYRKADNTEMSVEEANLLVRRETQRFLNNFGITIKELDKFEHPEPFFDALNKVIYAESAKDITDKTGEAVAFMMQYDPSFKKLVSLDEIDGSPSKLKGIKRAIKKRGFFDIGMNSKEYSRLDKTKYIKIIGKDIAKELRKLYNIEEQENSKSSYLQKIGEIINSFFEHLTPSIKNEITILKNNSKIIAESIKNNNPTIIINNNIKPGTNKEAYLVNIEQALKDYKYEEKIISLMSNNNIALAGSASMATFGTVYRPAENPLHDLDFEASNKSKEEIEKILKSNFKSYALTNIIKEKDGTDRITYTYLVMDRDFYEKDGTIYESSTNKIIGKRKHSELVLVNGVKGKMLDFFMGKGNSIYGRHKEKINNKEYIFSDYKNAMEFKVEKAREKDIWDYNRFIPNNLDQYGRVSPLEYKKKKISNWNSLSENDIKELENQGWTQELFDSITDEEKEQTLECAGIG